MTDRLDDPVVTPEGVNLRAVRRELGLSQTELARLVGFSVRAVQSVEQGWRQAGPSLEKSALLLLIAHRNGTSNGHRACWEVIDCPPECRDQCITHRTGQGHLCWFLSGTLCTAPLNHWDQKRERCLDCSVFQRLINPGQN